MVATKFIFGSIRWNSIMYNLILEREKTHSIQSINQPPGFYTRSFNNISYWIRLKFLLHQSCLDSIHTLSITSPPQPLPLTSQVSLLLLSCMFFPISISILHMLSFINSYFVREFLCGFFFQRELWYFLATDLFGLNQWWADKNLWRCEL